MLKALTDGWTYTATVRLGNAQDVIMCGNHETSLSISSILVKRKLSLQGPPAQLHDGYKKTGDMSYDIPHLTIEMSDLSGKRPHVYHISKTSGQEK
jgi:hypothetical protein